MKSNKTLASIVLAGTMALGIAGCGIGGNQSREYRFNDVIKEDSVLFNHYDGFFNDNAELTIKKSDGLIIEFLDIGADLKIDKLSFKKNGVVTSYNFWNTNDISKPILEEGQKQWDTYLSQIKDIKINEGLGNLSVKCNYM